MFTPPLISASEAVLIDPVGAISSSSSTGIEIISVTPEELPCASLILKLRTSVAILPLLRFSSVRLMNL